MYILMYDTYIFITSSVTNYPLVCGTMRCALNSTSTWYCMLTTILYPVPHDTFMYLSLFCTKVDVGTCTWYLVSVLIVVLTNILTVNI
jgi:hypothetical protein